jgi:hypothetical protein
MRTALVLFESWLRAGVSFVKVARSRHEMHHMGKAEASLMKAEHAYAVATTYASEPNFHRLRQLRAEIDHLSVNLRRESLLKCDRIA